MVSIITTVHNQLDMNEIFYEHLTKYTHHEYELIIIDNNSNDGSAEFFESVGAKVIKNSENYTYPYTQNQGIKEAKYEYLAFLNNDIIVAPNWDKQLIETLEHNELSAVTCCGIERLESKFATKKAHFKWKVIKNSVAFFSSSKKAIRLMHKLMYPHWENFCNNRFKKYQYAVKEGFVGNSVLIKKSELEKIGLWDERIQAADWDLYLRMKERQLTNNDVKPLCYALGTYIHHYIRFTANSGQITPFYDRDNCISLDQKWGKEKKAEYLSALKW